MRDLFSGCPHVHTYICTYVSVTLRNVNLQSHFCVVRTQQVSMKCSHLVDYRGYMHFQIWHQIVPGAEHKIKWSAEGVGIFGWKLGWYKTCSSDTLPYAALPLPHHATCTIHNQLNDATIAFYTTIGMCGDSALFGSQMCEIILRNLSSVSMCMETLGLPLHSLPLHGLPLHCLSLHCLSLHINPSLLYIAKAKPLKLPGSVLSEV